MTTACDFNLEVEEDVEKLLEMHDRELTIDELQKKFPSAARRKGNANFI